MHSISKILAPIKRRILLLIGRAIVTYVDNSKGTQRLQLTLLADEVADGVEHFEEYGFSSYSLEGGEGVVGFLGGNRDHGIVLCVNDRRYRPTDLSQGESIMYTHEDVTAQAHRVYLKTGKKVILLTNVSLGCLDGTGRKLADERLLTAYNTHIHTDPQGGNTGVPTVQLVLANQFTANTEAL